MNPQEILTILRIEQLDEVEEALETELFELKKAVLVKPLLRLTLKSKLTRLDLLAKIAEDQKLFQQEDLFEFAFDVIPSDQVLGLWESYMQAKSQWKMAFSRTQSPIGLMKILEEGLKMERIFSEQFKDLDWIADEPVFGVEPDPMLIQNGLKKASQKGWHSFTDLEKNKSELEKELLLALKRLSLLPKYLH